jgi:hypothetical protein
MRKKLILSHCNWSLRFSNIFDGILDFFLGSFFSTLCIVVVFLFIIFNSSTRLFSILFVVWNVFYMFSSSIPNIKYLLEKQFFSIACGHTSFPNILNIIKIKSRKYTKILLFLCNSKINSNIKWKGNYIL